MELLMVGLLHDVTEKEFLGTIYTCIGKYFTLEKLYTW